MIYGDYSSMKYHLDDEMRERCKPTQAEIAEERRRIESNPCLTELEVEDILEDWIRSETEMNVTEECAESGAPRIFARQKKRGKV